MSVFRSVLGNDVDLNKFLKLMRFDEIDSLIRTSLQRLVYSSNMVEESSQMSALYTII